MTRRTRIRCGELIAFDGAEHRLLRNVDLVVRDDRVESIGNAAGPFDAEIDASHRLVSPGFVNLHLHSGSTVATRLVTERRYPSLFNAGYLAFSPRKGATPIGAGERAEIGGRATAVELLKSGCTTVVDLGQGCDPEAMATIFGELGIRAYLAPGFRSGAHVFVDGRLEIEWFPDEGLAALRAAVAFIERHAGRFNGRIQGMLFPYQGDTCTDRLLQETKAAARALGVKMQMHAAQSLYELHEMLRRTGKTTIQHFAEIGFLGPDLILAHCPFITGHPSTGLPGDEDLRLLGAFGVAVCHSPTTLFRRGHLLRSFDRYRAAGVTLALGTDHYPRDMMHEMRLASLMGKVAENDPGAADSLAVFNAATIGGATALGRPDLGRLYPGAKADLLVIDLRRIGAAPLRDPVQDLVLTGIPSDIKLVMIDGRVVCENGVVPGIDEDRLVAELQANAEAIFATIPNWHPTGGTVEEVAPRFLKPMDVYRYTPPA
ncbi:MAG: amidohydrolase family protein [Chloroflexota bacterium]|nr:amidohydrolase family protein [Dehalococcoidia bacterium]MDW8253209.1 amidohydrolase family protein [Chloroflexota bacterium]